MSNCQFFLLFLHPASKTAGTQTRKPLYLVKNNTIKIPIKNEGRNLEL
jgi:hypothetical protein